VESTRHAIEPKRTEQALPTSQTYALPWLAACLMQ